MYITFELRILIILTTWLFIKFTRIINIELIYIIAYGYRINVQNRLKTDCLVSIYWYRPLLLINLLEFYSNLITWVTITILDIKS